MGVAILVLLGIVYRRWSLWVVHASALLLSMLGLVASLKMLHLSVNLLNALAFPLVLAIGVDYGIQFLVVSRREGDLRENLANVLKPLLICGLATFAGFAVLIPAQNPALSGLGTHIAMLVEFKMESLRDIKSLKCFSILLHDSVIASIALLIAILSFLRVRESEKS